PVWLWLTHTTDLLPGSANIWLPAHLIYFVAGMTLAVLQARGVRCRTWLALTLALAALLTVAAPVAGNISGEDLQPWQPILKTFLYAVFACGLMAPLVLGDGGGYARLLASRPVVWLGEISYEIFLLHVIV